MANPTTPAVTPISHQAAKNPVIATARSRVTAPTVPTARTLAMAPMCQTDCPSSPTVWRTRNPCRSTTANLCKMFIQPMVNRPAADSARPPCSKLPRASPRSNRCRTVTAQQPSRSCRPTKRLATVNSIQIRTVTRLSCQRQRRDATHLLRRLLTPVKVRAFACTCMHAQQSSTYHTLEFENLFRAVAHRS